MITSLWKISSSGRNDANGQHMSVRFKIIPKNAISNPLFGEKSPKREYGTK